MIACPLTFGKYHCIMNLYTAPLPSKHSVYHKPFSESKERSSNYDSIKGGSYYLVFRLTVYVFS
jgi:hypothetical protein